MSDMSDLPDAKTADAFLAQLRASRVLSGEDIEDATWNLRLRELEDDMAVARALIKAKRITKYQAKQILRGRGRNLVINGYKILYRLGAGGMGEVFAAEEIETGWEVAFKVLTESRRDDRGMTTRFQMEAEAGIRLTHPNLLRTFSMGTYGDGEGYYAVMELVKGVSLRELLTIHPQFDWRQICDIIAQAAAGLHYAHERGLVHRDVKPENLLIRTDGSVKILDFGLAMQGDSEEEFSMAMIMGQNRLGTADYVAPEQIIDSHLVDRRADVYSLGCAMYFGLTGKVPYPEDSVRQKLIGHCKGRPKPVEEFRDDLPQKLLAILAKMMAKHPKNRIATAEEVARYLKPYRKRDEVEFDFVKIVDARARLAKRLALLKASRTGLTSSAGSGTPEPPKSEADTMFRDDTDVNEENQRGEEA